MKLCFTFRDQEPAAGCQGGQWLDNGSICNKQHHQPPDKCPQTCNNDLIWMLVYKDSLNVNKAKSLKLKQLKLETLNQTKSSCRI